MPGTVVMDDGWLTLVVDVALGLFVGAAAVLFVVRRRGHVRVSVEVGDPPTPPRRPIPPPGWDRDHDTPDE